MGRSLRLLIMLALAMGVAPATTTAVATAAQPTPPTIEDENDRRTANPLVEEAWRSREAVELFRAGERGFVPDPNVVGDVIAPTPARPVPDRPLPAAPRPGVGVVASLLLGLVGGVVGGSAALAGWTAAARRRPHEPASAT
jgi:hypothetical protein